MLKEFMYVRKSGTGREYKVSYLVQITNDYVTIHQARFSLSEIFYENRRQLEKYLLKNLKTSDRRVVTNAGANKGAPTHPINKGGHYYNVDGKLYRCDKNLEYRTWSAPIEHVLRIIMNGKFDNEERYIEVPSLSSILEKR